MKISLLLLFVFAGVSFARDVNTIYPYPKAAWNKPGQFAITGSTVIVTSETPTKAETNAIKALQSIFKKIGVTPTIITTTNYSGTGGIVIGEIFSNNVLRDHITSVSPQGEGIPLAQGYIIDISANEILIAGSDSDGVFNAVTTFAQLINPGKPSTISGAHVWDYPDYPDRWVFSGHNLLVGSQLSTLEAIADTMSFYKLNGIQQNDLKYSILQLMWSAYFNNVDSLRSHLKAENIDLIPGVIGIGWSSGILYNDPNLAEGLPATATYLMEADTGRLIPDPRVTLANGGFENVNSNNIFTDWDFYDGPNQSAFQDKSIFHSGSASSRCTDFTQGNPAGNCRFSKLLSCDSNKYYSMSAWIKTENLQGGFVQMLALGGASGQTLTFTQLTISPTMDWTRVEVNFNTLGNTSVRLYIGVWGGQSGTIWFDDFAIKEAGLSSVLRRDGCPLSVQNKNTGHVYSEGIDYAYVIDPLVDANKDSYFPYHTPPTFKRISGGAIHNGDSISIHYYHPFAAISDNNGNGSVMACISEDTLWKILGDQVTRVNNLYHPAKFFMGHDEIRNMNHDKSCLDRHESPSDLLSDNMTRCHDLIKSTSPDAEVFMWSDMVDSLHNAHNNYYLVNGDLTGDWNNIPKDITIGNWNGGNAKASLAFFEDHGFSQITSPYYDAGNTSTIRAWRIAQEGFTKVKGMMYTTWANDYNFLRPFAYYAWGAGPNIIHTPLDTSVLQLVNFTASATVIPDPFDNTDKITSVKINIMDSNSKVLNTFSMIGIGNDIYSVTIPNAYQDGFRYSISATNSQGLKRQLPAYIIASGSKATVSLISDFNLSLSNYPNPFNSETRINFTIPYSGFVLLKIFDILGREIQTLTAANMASGNHTITFDGKNIPAGNYIYRIETADGILSKEMQIVK